MLVRFEVYAVTGLSEDSERDGFFFFRMGVVRRVRRGVTIISHEARLPLYEEIIWMKLQH